jgi:cold-inducible RNA-binding protein
MGKKLYVGNLSYSINDQTLNDLFTQFGAVESAKVITDRNSGRSKGFGFVEMTSDDEATQAIEKLNGTEQDGRDIIVNEARPMEPREGGSRGGDRGGRGGYGGGRGGDRGGRGGSGGGNRGNSW